METINHIMSPEQIAEMEKQKNQELYGPHVQKIGGCAVVTVDNEVISLEIPITYSELVSAIIRKRYDEDQVEALTANYLATMSDGVTLAKTTEYQNEYKAYNAWRSKAKQIAKEVIGTV